MDVFQVSALDMVNMSLAPAASLLVGKNMDLEHVVKHRTVEDNREQVQVSPLAVNSMGLAQVSLLAMVNMDLVLVDTFQTLIKKSQVQVNFLIVDNMGLALDSPLALDNTDQAQVNPLTLDMALVHARPLVLDNMSLAQDSPLVLANMGQAQDRPLALASIGLAQESPLAMNNMNPAQVSPLALENNNLVQDSPLVWVY